MVHAVWIDLCMVWVINILPWRAQGGSYFGGGPVQRQTRAGAGFHINTSLGCQLAGSHCHHTWHTDLQPRERTLGGTQCPWCYAGNFSLSLSQGLPLSVFVSGYLLLSLCRRVSLTFSLSLSFHLRVSLFLPQGISLFQGISLSRGVSFHLRVSLFTSGYLFVSGYFSLCLRVSLFVSGYLSLSLSQGISLSDRVWDNASLTENEWASD